MLELLMETLRCRQWLTASVLAGYWAVTQQLCAIIIDAEGAQAVGFIDQTVLPRRHQEPGSKGPGS